MAQEILKNTGNSIIVALSDTTVGKVVLPNPLTFVDVATGKPVKLGKDPTLEDEMATLIYANTINDLLPQFIKKQTWEEEKEEGNKIHDMMVMERLYSLPIHHFDLETRKIMFEDFETKIKELHDNNFVHGDFLRPTNYFTRNNKAWMFANVIQTETRLRLIDTGFSKIMNKDNIREFCQILIQERDEIDYFKTYYLK
jgi:hypothetical protein